MTDAILIPARSNRLTQLFGKEPLFAATGLALAASLLVTLPAMGLDTRLFQGESIWIKPIKFQIALMIYLLTLAFFAQWLPAGMTARRSYRIYAGIVVFTIIGELAWISGAAMFGTASHYNVGTPLMAGLYTLMGVFAVTLTSASLVYGVAIWRDRATGPSAGLTSSSASVLAPALKLSIALGLILNFALTVPIAGTLAALPGHFVGVPLLDATVPFIGWSREVGDLRAPHFFATHAMHFLPLAGLAYAKWGAGSSGKRAIWAVAMAYVAFTAVIFVQALNGLPLVPLF